jgi:hypothetical protein
MKKQILISLIIMCSGLTMNAQWNGTNPVWTTSNVGIGTGYNGVGIISPVEKFTIGEMGGNFAVQDRRTSTTEKYSSGYKFYDYIGESASILLEHNSYFGNGTRALKFLVNGAERVRINADGYLGIGTDSPSDLLQIGKYNTGYENNLTLWTNGAGAGEQSKIKFKMLVSGGNSNSTIAEFVPYTYVNDGKNRLDIRVGDWNNNNNSGSSKMSILSNGFIGVGTENPLYKLDVCGTIRAKEVKVDLQGTCVPDFVFKKDYKLMSLNELEKFVITKQHLPEIASEKDMTESGLNMKEFQMKLLQKMEEMTLYIIEQNKKNEKQEHELKILKNEIKKMKIAKNKN